MRIVLKISGESLKKDSNISENCLNKIYEDIRKLSDGNQLIIIVGGGNFWRGRNKLSINSDISDYVGMLATVMNSLALSSYLNEAGTDCVCYSAFDIPGVIKKASLYDVLNDLESGRIVIFGGGLGVPNLSTDMTTVSKAIEYNADLILMSKNIDAVYDKDPKTIGAKRISEITHEDLLKSSLNQGIDSLMILDVEALTSLAKHKIPLYVYNSNCINDISEVFNGDAGTAVITK